MIENGAVFTPTHGTPMFLEGMVQGAQGSRMVRWKVLLDTDLIWVPNSSKGHAWQFTLGAHITEANFVATLDERLINQRESIDRIMRHLKGHCPQLMGKGSCEHLPV